MMLRETDEERAVRQNYLRIQSFRNQLRTSRTLTHQQKSTLWGQARSGDLEGAMKGYRKLTSLAKEG